MKTIINVIFILLFMGVIYILLQDDIEYQINLIRNICVVIVGLRLLSLIVNKER